MDHFVQLFQQRNRFEILAPAKLVRHPLPLLSAVVQIEHRRDGIHSQAVEVKFLEPIERVADQEIPHFITPIVEDVCAPIRMLAFARIEMLVQGGTIEAPKCERVLGKVRGHPVHNHTDPAPVQIVDQITKIVRRAVAGRRRIVAADLITPGWSVRMFLQRQKLDMRKAHLGNIVSQERRHLAIGQRPVVFFSNPSPRSKMNFIDRERLAKMLAAGALFQPLLIAKLVLRLVNNR